MPSSSTWSKTPPTVRSLAPRLGEHSRALLAEPGYSNAEIDTLVREGVSAVPREDGLVEETEC
jgi:crotonobetainyl-CoA:carnitine CoA-transferase CaiB-like acyl-CoA transferase